MKRVLMILAGVVVVLGAIPLLVLVAAGMLLAKAVADAEA